nr:hypothetical protein [Rubrobacter marinus]
MQYTRNDYQLARGTFRVRGDVLEVHPAYQDTVYRVSFFGTRSRGSRRSTPSPARS